MRAWILATVLLGSLLLSACFRRAVPGPTPAPSALGRCDVFDREQACADWEEASTCTNEHDSFPALTTSACFVPIRYEGGLPTFDAFPIECGYPTAESGAIAELSAARFADATRNDAPLVLQCLPPAELDIASRVNSHTLRSVRHGRRYPYAAIATFGFGHAAHNASALVGWRPGDHCPQIDKREMDRLGINRIRAARGAEAYHARIAPVVIVSGSAVHGDAYEAFLHYFLLTCVFDVPGDAVLLDPCADHTHTNVRNTGSLVQALGGRTAYLVTDSGLQAKYLQEETAFDLVGGSIDQRALRDFGYLLGAWRQASVGIDAGFWYTPYRFWAEPRNGLGSFSCIPL